MERRSPKMTVHSRLPHDVEKGLPTSSSPFGLFQRRRRLTVVLLLCSAMALFIITVSHQTGQTLSTWNWVKDGMRPSSDSSILAADGVEVKVPEGMVPSASSLDTHLEPEGYAPSTALIGLADKMGVDIASGQPKTEEKQSQKVDVLNPADPASREDRILLLLRLIKNPDYLVQLKDWRKTLLPATIGDMAATLKQFFGPAESIMYLDHRAAWAFKQHTQAPLTVFSKSYCPYSRKAKELLREQHAKFDVYEVDLRADAEQLQMALREISGHRTVSFLFRQAFVGLLPLLTFDNVPFHCVQFPAIFLKDDLIGGSDSLQHLQDLGVLSGMLAAAKAL